MTDFSDKDQNQNLNTDNNNGSSQNQDSINQNLSDNSQNQYNTSQYQSNNTQYQNNNPQYQSNNTQYQYDNTQYQNNNSQYQNSNSQYQNSNSQYQNNNSQYQNSNYQYQNNNTQTQSNNTQNNKVPDYSFWAEQMPRNPYSYNNTDNNNSNAWQYGNQMPNMNQNPNMNQMNHGQQKEKKKSGSGKKVFKFITKSVCFGLIAAVSFIGLGKLIDTVYPQAASVGILAAVDSVATDSNYKVNYTDAATVKTASKSAVSKVADSTLPAIVSINCTSTQTAQDWFGQQYSQDMQSSGSGIIVGKTDKELLIATNNHVVEGANKINITFKDGTKAEATTKGADSTADLAVVSVNISNLESSTLKTISVAKLGDSDKVKVGQMVVAIGNALGYGQSITYGCISAKDREVEVSENSSSTTNKMKLLQTDAAINPGNSGGALLNMDGEVIGINSVKYASDEVEGMGYAIPISTATPIIKELMNREVLSKSEQGFLGISGYDVTDDASSYYNIPVGVFIKDTLSGGAVDKAGLKAEDVITGVDDTKISSISQLKEYVSSKKVGTKVKITYMRNSNGKYEKATAIVTLQQNPNWNSSNN